MKYSQAAFFSYGTRPSIDKGLKHAIFSKVAACRWKKNDEDISQTIFRNLKGSIF